LVLTFVFLLLLPLLLLQELTADDVERFRSDDTISQFFDQLSSSYPELIAPLIAGEETPWKSAQA
jgi:inner membrane protein involved in colicin E2 resistance